jgi:hypothetical protein
MLIMSRYIGKLKAFKQNHVCKMKMLIGTLKYCLTSLNMVSFKPLLNPIVLLSKPNPKSYETLNSHIHFCAAVFHGRKIGSRMLQVSLWSSPCSCVQGCPQGMGSGILEMGLELPSLFLDSWLLVLKSLFCVGCRG